jgi:hypothetical protein
MEIIIERPDNAITKKLFKIRLRIYNRMNYVYFFGMCGMGIILVTTGNSQALTGAGITFILFGLMKLISTLMSISKTIANYDELIKFSELHLNDDAIRIVSKYMSITFKWTYFKNYLLRDGNIFIYESSILNAVSIAKDELSVTQFNELKTKLENYGVLPK